MTEKGVDRVREMLANVTAGPSSAADALARAEMHAATMLAPADPAGPGPDGFDGAPPWEEVGEDAEPSDTRAKRVDPEVVAECAKLDQSDTDNGRRLILHYGRDLCVLETENVASGDYIVWVGDHWDAASGNDAALRVAQKIGGHIALEADHLAHTAIERDLMRKADALKPRSPDTLTDAERDILAAAKAVPAALAGRKRSRRAFGVTSKNQGRIANMLRMAAPHLTRKPDAFNADAHLVATRGHTLRFAKAVAVERELDPECPDPDAERWIERKLVRSTVDPIPGHNREDLITKVMPVNYDPEALCPLWDAFLAECLPDEAVRRCVQVFSGLGMTGIGLQKVLFHYGNGANGKSVFMETLMRVMGPLGVGLPAASLVGENRATGQQASPDIARLYGARIVRVAELPADEPVKEELVKLLTGGESMPVRNLFKGFFEFTPVFKAHMSGNGYPRIDGTDNGIWRRMVVIPWTVTIPEERRREFREVVAELAAEGSGILNWLIEGVLIFLREGFQVPEAAVAATKEYRDDMDPIGQFLADCVLPCAGQNVQARTMYEAYVSWSMANAKKPWGEPKFGKVMKTKDYKNDGARIRQYLDCQLHEVPARPAPEGSGEGSWR